MKNIHLIPTDKPSRLGYLTKKGKEVFKDLRFFDAFMPTILDGENQNIYITNDEIIKDGDWCHDSKYNVVFQCNTIAPYTICKDDSKHISLLDDNLKRSFEIEDCKKIILTTDQDLINEGVQNIENEFLEWFVNSSSCEFVEVEKTMYMPFDGKVAFELSLDESLNTRPYYKIIIPEKEKDPEQETIEEILLQKIKELDSCNLPESFQGGYANGFVNGAKWQADRMYTEDDFKLFARQYYRDIKLNKSNLLWDDLADKCLEEFKNK